MGAVVLNKRPLGASVAYTQDKQDRFHDTEPIGGVRGHIYADKAGTLYLEESDDDGATWTTTATVSVSASVTAKLDWTAMSKRWYRFRYVNGAAAQTKFVLMQQTRGMELDDVQLSGSNFEQTIGAALPTKAALMGISDGVNIKAMLGNTTGTLLASAARTVAIQSPAQTNINAKGVMVFLNVTVASGTGGVSLTVVGVDPVSGLNCDLMAASAAKITTGISAIVVYPGAGAAAGQIKSSISQPLPKQWAVYVGVGDASSYTYSLSYSYIL